MRSWLSAALVALTAGLASSSAAAQDPADALRVITLAEALDLALERNTDVLRGRADVDLREAVELRERMDFLPELSIGTRARRSFGRSFSQEEGTILSETSDVFDTGLSASVNLFDGMEKVASLREAALAEEASRLRLDRTREDVLFQVVEGFTTLVLDRELAEVRAEELTAAEELLQQVRRLVDLGRQPLSDLYQQQAVHAEAEAALIEAERQVALDETILMQVLELDPLAEYDFRAPAVPDAAPAVAEYELEALLDAAFARRADLAALERSVAASEAGVTAARAGWWPSLSMSFDYGSNWSSNSVPTAFLEQLDGRRGGGVSLSLNIPVFDGLQTRAAVEQAAVSRLNARLDLQDQRQTVALQVRQALLDYRAAAARQEATARRLEAAERGWTAAERRYELGAATFVEVVQARSTLVSARSAALRARFSLLLAGRLIDYHTGALDDAARLLDFGEADDDE